MPHPPGSIRTTPSSLAAPAGLHLPAPGLPAEPGGLLARWLRHPASTQARWWHQLTRLLTRLLTQHERQLLLAAGVAIVALAAAVVLASVTRRRATRRGRWVQIRPPAQPHPAGGLALWRQLAPLLSAQPAWNGRRPPAGFEVLAEPGATTVGLWLSPSMPVAAVCRAVATAWPGATTTATSPPPLAGRRGKQRRSSAAQVRLGAAEWFPLAGAPPHTSTSRTSSISTSANPGSTAGAGGLDPLRGLLEALTDLPDGATAVLQVLARPATGRRLARARRAARTAHTARTARNPSPSRPWPAALLDRPSAGQPRPSGPGDPFALEDARLIRGKLSDAPLFQVAIRVAVTSPTSSRAGRRARRGWLRQIAAACGLYTARNQLIVRRQRRPAATLGARRLGRGMLLSAGELTAVAHLPAEPSRHAMAVAAARSVPPPAELSHD